MNHTQKTENLFLTNSAMPDTFKNCDPWHPMDLVWTICKIEIRV